MKKNIFIILGLSFMLTGCSLFINPILVEYDRVLNERRASLDVIIINNKLRGQNYTQTLTFLKEIASNRQVSYTLYDVIQLPSSSFDLEEKMYLLIDNEVFELQTTFTNHQKNRYSSEQTTEIQLNESTKQKVVTGYDIIDKKTIQMVHTLSAEQIDKMNRASSISLQYYTGPSMLHSKLKNKHLRRVRRWIRN